jgi:glycosyl transferase family 25
MELNDYFDKIFVITIPRNKQRLDALSKSLGNLKYELYNGVDGRTLYPEFEYVAEFPDSFFEENDLDKHRLSRLNKGQLGCALSNRNLQKKIVDENIGKALILEDDIYLDLENADKLDTIFKELPADWDLLYLGFTETCPQFKRPFRLINYIHHLLVKRRITTCSNRNYLKYYPHKYSSTLDTPGLFFGTHAYAISTEGGRKLLEHDSPLGTCYDENLMRCHYYHSLKSFSVYKKIFRLHPFESTLNNR